MAKRVVVLFPLPFQASIHLGKEVTQFALAISSKLSLDLEILCFGFINDAELPRNIRVFDVQAGNRSAKIIPLFRKLMVYFFQNRGSIVVLVAFFWGFWAWIIVPLYHLFNRGKAVNKLDGNPRRIASLNYSSQTFLKREFSRVLIWIYSRWVDMIVCESNALRDSLIASYPNRGFERKAHVIQGGLTREFVVACEAFSPRQPLKSDRIRVLLLGRVNLPFKGLEVFLDTIPRTLSPNIEFVICGPSGPWSDGIMRKFLESHPSQESRVRFIGEARGVGAVAQILADCDVLCLPSIDTEEAVESFGLVLVEAMASGLYFVASDAVPSAQDLVGEGYGGVFRSGDSTGLAHHLDGIAHNPELLDLSRAQGLSRARELYTYEAMAGDALSVLW